MTTGSAASASADWGSCAVGTVLRSQLRTGITPLLIFHPLGTGPGHRASCQAHSVNPQLLQGFRALSLRRSLSLRLCLWSHTVTALRTGNKGSLPSLLCHSVSSSLSPSSSFLDTHVSFCSPEHKCQHADCDR